MRRAATYAKAHGTYIARREGELTVRDNERLIVLEQEGVPPGYVLCRSKDGVRGLLPRDVVITSPPLSISRVWESLKRHFVGPALDTRDGAPSSGAALAPAAVRRRDPDPPTSMGLALEDAAWPTPAAVYRSSHAQPPRSAIPKAAPVLGTKREPMPPPPEAEANGLLLLALDAGVLLSDALYQELVRMAGSKANDNKMAELLLSWREYDALCKIVEAESLTERVTPESALGLAESAAVYSEPPEPADCASHPPAEPTPETQPARVAPSGGDVNSRQASLHASASAAPASPSARQMHPSTLLPNHSEYWGPLLDADTGAELHIPIDLRAPLQFAQGDLEAHGPWRGIQADSKDSCLLDCTVYALFAFSTALDRHVTRARATPIMEACFDHLWCRTVGPLRARNYVGRDALSGVRSVLRPWLSLVPPNSPDSVDAFLHAVLGDVFKAQPLCVLASAKGECLDSFLLRLSVDPWCPDLTDCTNGLSLEKLLAASLHFQQLRFHTVPDVLILQMPRNGTERIFDRIYPIAELDLAPYMVVAPFNNVVRMHLSAVVCVSIGRFVAYVRSPRDEWFALDPLADRTTGGANVPCVSALPSVAALLSAEGFSHFVSGAFPSDRTPEGRLLRDPYLCVYVHAQ